MLFIKSSALKVIRNGGGNSLKPSQGLNLKLDSLNVELRVNLISSVVFETKLLFIIG